MGITEIILGIILIVLAVAFVTCVLLQSGKDKRLSGTIAGGAADTFFAKGKTKSKDKVLSMITTVLAIMFVVVAVVAVIVITASPVK